MRTKSEKNLSKDEKSSYLKVLLVLTKQEPSDFPGWLLFVLKNCLFYSLYILPATRIDTNFVTWIDEERNVNNGTGFERCGLGDIVCSITTHSRFGAFYPQLQEVG